MNIITFDIEEWFIEKHFYGNRSDYYKKYDSILEHIIQILDEHHVKATFFCLGELAGSFPHVINKIASNGHEIGCHSNNHRWLNKMTQQELREDTKRAIYSLENLVGKKVKSYRAPAFSIGQSNVEAFDVLAEYGIEYDASIFPASRDFGGFDNFKSNTPLLIRTSGSIIKEFPISPVEMLNRKIVCTGGGYFRLYPLFLIKKWVCARDYNMFYFHIADLLNEEYKFMSRKEYESYFKEEGSMKNRVARYIKSNIGTAGAIHKLERLVASTDFMNLAAADKIWKWEQADTFTYGCNVVG